MTKIYDQLISIRFFLVLTVLGSIVLTVILLLEKSEEAECEVLFENGTALEKGNLQTWQTNGCAIHKYNLK